MSPNVLLEIAELQDKTVSQLVRGYEQVFEEECRSRNKQYLIRRIAWRLQANEEGGLSRAALKKAEELAIGAETRVTAPKGGCHSRARAHRHSYKALCRCVCRFFAVFSFRS